MYSDISEAATKQDGDDSPFTCIKCGAGKMRAVNDDSDPEYSDHFECPNCHHQDSIPALSYLASQIFTGIFGSSICVYLLINNLHILLQGFQTNSLESSGHLLGLVAVAGCFIAAFAYVITRAIRGIQARNAYQQTPPL